MSESVLDVDLSDEKSLESWFAHISRHRDLVEETLTNVMERARKPRRIQCPHCNKWDYHNLEDSSAQVRAAEVTASQLQKLAEFLAKKAQAQGGSGPDWGVLAGYPLEVKQRAFERLSAELAKEDGRGG